MKLLLTSSGLTNKKVIASFLSLLSKPVYESTGVFITTAANADPRDKGWLIRHLTGFYQLGFKEFNIFDMSGVSQKATVERIKNSDVVIFGGGNTFHLMYWLTETGITDRYSELFDNRVYVGISAGSIVATPSLKTSGSEKHIEAFGKENGQIIERGMGMVQFQIKPHLNSPKYPSISKQWGLDFSLSITEPLYVIDDNTAIKVDGSDIEVVSEGDWYKLENGLVIEASSNLRS